MTEIRDADCCRTCKSASAGYFKDTVLCLNPENNDLTSRDVFKWQICDEFERKVSEE